MTAKVVKTCKTLNEEIEYLTKKILNKVENLTYFQKKNLIQELKYQLVGVSFLVRNNKIK